MLISGSKLGLALQMKKELKRRNAVEPVRGHLKTDSNLGRQDPCPLMRSRAQYSASSISISKPSLCRLQKMLLGVPVCTPAAPFSRLLEIIFDL